MEDDRERDLIERLKAITDRLRDGSALGSVSAVASAVGASESSTRTWFGWRSDRLSAPTGPRRQAAQQVIREHLGGDALREVEQIWKEREARAETRAYGARTARHGPRLPSDDPTERRRISLGRQYLRGGWPVASVAEQIDGSLRLGSDVAKGDLPPYVERGIDVQLDERLGRATLSSASAEERIVGVAGPAKAGKTRSLVESLRRMPDAARTRLLVVQVPPPNGGATWLAGFVDSLILTDVATYANPARCVVLIDDLHLICTGGEVWPEIERLVKACPSVIVCFTIHGQYLEPAAKDHVGAVQHSLDLRAMRGVCVSLASDLTFGELSRAAALYPELERNELVRLAERFASTPFLIGEARRAKSDPDARARAALVYALQDLALMRPAGTTREHIAARQAVWWEHLAPTSGPLLPDAADEAFRWATRPTGKVWSLCMSTEPGRDQWRLHDGVQAALDREHAPLRSICYDPTVSIAELLSMAFHFREWAYNVYYPMLEAAIGRSVAVRTIPLKEILGPDDDGRLDRLMDAVHRGHPDAIIELADHYAITGRLSEAWRLWGVAAVIAGHPTAFLRMGLYHHERGEMDEAVEWLDRAAKQSHPYALHALGTIAQGRGDDASAEAFYKQAANLGQVESIRCLGMLRVEAGDPEGRPLLRKAEQLGDAMSSELLATLDAIDAEGPEGVTAEQRFLASRRASPT